ncbi:MAG: hypothetical protein IPI67_07720 [Myxococcales bacterium]|nr:hypothetical protein [Myxococcales bacterium]
MPGLPPGQVPQIGYGFGAPMSPGFQQFQQFQQDQVGHAIKRAGWITAVAFLVPVVMLVVIGGVVALWLLL